MATRKKKSKHKPTPPLGPPPLKGDITISLSCGHQLKVTERPNPRKVWPDPITCPEHKRKSAVWYIHTITPKKN